MVSRALLATSRLAITYLFVFLMLLASVSESQARTRYTFSDGGEGDPGDGVLQPKPQVIPDPVTITMNNSSVVFTIVLVNLGDNHFLPVFKVSNFNGNPVFIPQLNGLQSISERRWHRAP